MFRRIQPGLTREYMMSRAMYETFEELFYDDECDSSFEEDIFLEENCQLPLGPPYQYLIPLYEEESFYWKVILDFLGAPLRCDRPCKSPILHAVRRLDVAGFQKLLANPSENVDICDDPFGVTPLAMICLLSDDSNPRVRVNGLTIAEKLIEKGANVNCRFAAYTVKLLTNVTPIAAAVMGSASSLVRLLLKKGADPSVEVLPTKTTCIFYAAINGNASIFDLLLRSGANIHHRDIEDNTVLIIACAAASDVIVKIILNQNHTEKVNIHAQNQRRCTALHAAAYSGNSEIIELLLKFGANVNARTSEGFTPLDLSVIMGWEDAERTLKRNGGTLTLCPEKISEEFQDLRLVTPYGKATPFRVAAYENSVEAMQKCLTKTVDINERDMYGRTALHLTSMNNAREAAEFLLKNGAEIDARTFEGHTPLTLAVLNGSENVVKLLFQHKASTDHETPIEFITGTSLFHIVCQIPIDKRTAASRGMKESVEKVKARITKLLLSKYVPFDVKNSMQMRPYDLARSKSREVEEILDRQNQLFKSIQRSDLNALDDCIKKGSIVNCRSIRYKTPLQFAVTKGHLGVVNLLLKRGADVNYALPDGVTALHYAAKFSQPEIALKLLLSGASFNATTVKFGKTPLDFVVEEKEGEQCVRMAQILRFIQSAFDLAGTCPISSTDLLTVIGSAKNVENQTISSLLLR